MAYIDDFGNHYNDDTTELICVNRKIKSLVVPSSVRIVNEFAFLDSNLEVIVFTNHIDSIHGFYGLRISEICVPLGLADHFVQLFDNNEMIRKIIKEIDFQKVDLCYNTGISMLDGNGVAKNIPKALEYLDYCVKNYDVRAIYKLAQYYESQHQYIKAYNRYLKASCFLYKDAVYKKVSLENLADQEQKYNEEKKQDINKNLNIKNKWIKNEQFLKFCFFDTETTGLPKNNRYDLPPSRTEIWPRLVQLAWIITDERGNVRKKRNVIIRPDGFEIPQEAANIHHITTAMARRDGIGLGIALNEFLEDLKDSVLIVGHNIDFDKKVIGAELCRQGKNYNDFMRKPFVCTMLSTTNYCKLPPIRYNEYKWPKLSELYFKLFNRQFDDAHNALADVVATKECYFELKKRGVI